MVGMDVMGVVLVPKGRLKFRIHRCIPDAVAQTDGSAQAHDAQRNSPMTRQNGDVAMQPAADRKDLAHGEAGGVSTVVNVFGSRDASLSPSTLLEAIAAAGFKYIQVPNDPQWASLAARVSALGLKVGQVHGSLAASACSLDEQERAQAVADEAKRMSVAAVYAPCPYVIHYLPRYNDPKRRDAFRRSVTEMLALAIPLKFTIAVETVPYKPDKDERYADSGEVAAFVRSFQSDNMRACIDLNHANINEDLVQAIRNCTGIIACIHISDNHGSKEEHLLPGEGTIDFPPAFKALREAGFTGPLNLEALVSAEDKRDPAEVLVEIRKWLEEQDRLSRQGGRPPDNAVR
jgi:sugar phosphate isomerase/epimerase